MSRKESNIVDNTKVITVKAKSHVISNEKDMEIAVELLSQHNKALAEVTAEKEKVTKPLNEALKAERARWKPIETELEDAIAFLRRSMSTYQTEQKRLQKIAEDKIAARIGEGKGKIKIETASKKIAEVAVAPKNVAAQSGSVRFKTVKCFEVVDVSKLPIDCISANVVEIRKKMNAGVEVEGVRYYEEEQATNFRN